MARTGGKQHEHLHFRFTGLFDPGVFLTLIGWLMPANSFDKSAKAQSKFYLGADISSLARAEVADAAAPTVYQENGQRAPNSAL